MNFDIFSVKPEKCQKISLYYVNVFLLSYKNTYNSQYVRVFRHRYFIVIYIYTYIINHVINIVVLTFIIIV